MNETLHCQRCGADHEAGTDFCAHCGSALAAAPRAGRPVRQPPWGLLARRLAGTVVVLGLVAALGLMLWPADPRGRENGAEAARSFGEKRERLRQAGRAGTRHVAWFTETEVNAYLDRVLAEGGHRGARDGRPRVRSVNVSFRPGEWRLVLASGWPMLASTYSLGGRLEAGGPEGIWRPEWAAIGHLPVVGVAVEWVARRVGRLFRELERDRRLLRQAAAFRIEEGRIMVRVGGNPATD